MRRHRGADRRRRGRALAVGADVAATIAFLVSEDASFVSGRR
jgi:hypothetical protein